MVALNNLCVDIMVEMDVLPGAGAAAKRSMMDRLQSSPPPPTSAWEVGGASNFAIAAARLGVDCTCLGHLGRDSYGDFVRETMAAEGVHVQELCTSTTAEETLVCWVLVDPHHRHSFCSRFDLTSEPLLRGLASIPPAASATIHAASALVVNGFVFDELHPAAVMQIVLDARAAHTPVFFDVGPRGKPLMADVPRQGAEALRLLLTHSDVLLLTEEEAAMVTGHSDPLKAADSLLTAPGSLVKWVVLKVGKDGCFVATRDGAVLHYPAMNVKVEDTVGCGDSLAAAVVLGYINGYEMMPTLALANAVGGATASNRGAGRNVATAAAVAALLTEAAREAPTAERRKYAAEALALLRATAKPAVQVAINGGAK